MSPAGVEAERVDENGGASADVDVSPNVRLGRSGLEWIESAKAGGGWVVFARAEVVLTGLAVEVLAVELKRVLGRAARHVRGRPRGAVRLVAVSPLRAAAG